MPRRYAEVEEETQYIDGDFQLAEYKYKPAYIRRWFVNNIIRRMFSYLVGFDGTKHRALRCTTGGILKVASVGAGWDKYESNPSQTVHEDWVTVSGTATSEETFSEVMSSIFIRCKDYEMVAEISVDGITYGHRFLIRGDIDEALSIDISTKKVRMRNKVTDGTQNGSYQIMGFK